MEIVKHGNTIKQYTCNECACVFNAAKSERLIEQNFYLHKIRYYVSCPECGRKIEGSFTEWEDAQLDFSTITNFILNFGLVILYLFCLWGAAAAIGLISIFIISLIEFINRPRKGRRK